MIKKLILILVCVAVPVYAATWRYVGGDAQNAIYYVDQDSITSGQYITRAWFKIDASKDRSVSHREEKRLYEAWCANRTLRLRQYILYRANLTVLESVTMPTNEEFKEVAPETIGEMVVDTLCKK